MRTDAVLRPSTAPPVGFARLTVKNSSDSTKPSLAMFTVKVLSKMSPEAHEMDWLLAV